VQPAATPIMSRRAISRAKRPTGVATTQRPAIIVHGGAGPEDPVDHAQRQRGCVTAVERAWTILERGGTALDATIAAVVSLEDDPHFNAGIGSCLTEDGRVEMDASVMDGRQLAAGAVGAVERLQNPIRLARAIMDDGRHVFLVGPQAGAFARAQGFADCAPTTLIVERHRRTLDRASPAGGASNGTVGAVAIDTRGHTAAATSTGGMAGKRPGRVGDSAVIGAGTYADDTLGAASATGTGEAIMRMTLARRALDELAGGADPTAVARCSVMAVRERLDATCGIILVDPTGRLGWGFTTEAMPIAFMHAGRATPATS
jgi:beta-aspartyl-peptidase (threonine type)